VLSVKNDVLCTLEDGTSFGEIALYGRMMRRTATVIAASYCDLDILLKSDFLELVREFPEMKQEIAQKAQDLATELKGRGLPSYELQILKSGRFDANSNRKPSEPSVVNMTNGLARKRGSTMLKAIQDGQRLSMFKQRLSMFTGITHRESLQVVPAHKNVTVVPEKDRMDEDAVDPVQMPIVDDAVSKL
jgi:hypothetical protein